MLKVNYQAAKKAYLHGKDVYVLPSLANENSPWWSKAKVTGDFDVFINEYKFYNCIRETGKCLKYFI